MSDIPPEPTKNEISTLRKAALKKLGELGNGEIDARDIKRLSEDDDYVRRFLMHHDNDQALALEMVIDTFKWRKELNVNDLTHDQLNKKLIDIGNLFPHNRDTDGFRMLIFSVSKHTKGVHDMDDMKKLLIYWLERLEREEYGKWISVVFDMRDTGMKNMDMEFIQYMIHLFKCYYPWILNNIIVLEMPWLLNAMWTIIKGWLPPKSIAKIKFVKKNTILEYVSKEQCLVGWGGTDDFQFCFEPELPQPLPWSAPAGDQEAKKVTFSDSVMDGAAAGAAVAAAGAAVAATSYNAVVGGAHPITARSLVTVSPAEELVFNCTRYSCSASLSISNHNNFPVFFKVKTTSPEKFRVRPSVGALAAGGGSVTVTVNASDPTNLPPAQLVREKFLVLAKDSSTHQASQQEVSDAFKAGTGGMTEVRLRVGVSSSTDSQNGTATPVAQTEAQLVKKLDEVLRGQQDLRKSLVMMQRLLLLLLVLSLLMLYFAYTHGGALDSFAQRLTCSQFPANDRQEL